MNPNDFRSAAHTFVDWMADYYEGVEAYPVRSPVAPGASPSPGAASAASCAGWKCVASPATPPALLASRSHRSGRKYRTPGARHGALRVR